MEKLNSILDTVSSTKLNRALDHDSGTVVVHQVVKDRK